MVLYDIVVFNVPVNTLLVILGTIFPISWLVHNLGETKSNYNQQKKKQQLNKNHTQTKQQN